jgi:NAD(P)H-dependent flavin oxidoreductase YrpB (nitropropane dioxygenase family)
VVDVVSVPVIAGGFMDGSVAAALALGAQATQGTSFLPARESGTFPAYRRRLCEATETDPRSATGKKPLMRIGK